VIKFVVDRHFNDSSHAGTFTHAWATRDMDKEPGYQYDDSTRLRHVTSSSINLWVTVAIDVVDDGCHG
jgi:hypothetical protein